MSPGFFFHPTGRRRVALSSHAVIHVNGSIAGVVHHLDPEADAALLLVAYGTSSMVYVLPEMTK